MFQTVCNDGKIVLYIYISLEALCYPVALLPLILFVKKVMDDTAKGGLTQF